MAPSVSALVAFFEVRGFLGEAVLRLGVAILVGDTERRLRERTEEAIDAVSAGGMKRNFSGNSKRGGEEISILSLSLVPFSIGLGSRRAWIQVVRP